LANYIDLFFTKLCKTLSDLEIESRLNTIKNLFGHMRNKDIFLNKARNLLS